MITIKLLGGAKRSFLSDKLSVEKNLMSVSELLAFLQNLVEKNMPPFDTKNILVAINGVDSSALQGNDTSVKDGDTVSIIPIVHGGSKTTVNFRVSNCNIVLVRLGKLLPDPTKLLESLRAKFPDVIIQGIRSKYALSLQHVRRVIEISLVASKAGTLLSNKIETDMLMRFAASRQISEAISKVGLQKGDDSILILIGKMPTINKLVTDLGHVVKPMTPFPKNDNFLKKEFKITKKELDCIMSREPLEDLLVERAAVLFH
ncbi:MAG TPA: KEOPS complex subunit Cgi121 [Candidatus Nitrosotalea sp.]|nr:MoaD/ThiS family protein [Nitrososphaerota archaeon]HKU32472.1 KEOPS complex subunit Cgi121 [Candidatus Nitrosotalea sp.]